MIKCLLIGFFALYNWGKLDASFESALEQAVQGVLVSTTEILDTKKKITRDDIKILNENYGHLMAMTLAHLYAIKTMVPDFKITSIIFREQFIGNINNHKIKQPFNQALMDACVAVHEHFLESTQTYWDLISIPAKKKFQEIINAYEIKLDSFEASAPQNFEIELEEKKQAHATEITQRSDVKEFQNLLYYAFKPLFQKTLVILNDLSFSNAACMMDDDDKIVVCLGVDHLKNRQQFHLQGLKRLISNHQKKHGNRYIVGDLKSVLANLDTFDEQLKQDLNNPDADHQDLQQRLSHDLKEITFETLGAYFKARYYPSLSPEGVTLIDTYTLTFENFLLGSHKNLVGLTQQTLGCEFGMLAYPNNPMDACNVQVLATGFMNHKQKLDGKLLELNQIIDREIANLPADISRVFKDESQDLVSYVKTEAYILPDHQQELMKFLESHAQENSELLKDYLPILQNANATFNFLFNSMAVLENGRFADQGAEQESDYQKLWNSLENHPITVLINNGLSFSAISENPWESWVENYQSYADMNRLVKNYNQACLRLVSGFFQRGFECALLQAP